MEALEARVRPWINGGVSASTAERREKKMNRFDVCFAGGFLAQNWLLVRCPILPPDHNIFVLILISRMLHYCRRRSRSCSTAPWPPNQYLVSKGVYYFCIGTCDTAVASAVMVATRAGAVALNSRLQLTACSGVLSRRSVFVYYT